MYTRHQVFKPTPLNIPVKVCPLSRWFPLPVPLGCSAWWRWRVLMVLTWARIQTVLVVPPAVGLHGEVPRRERGPPVHLALQVSDVVTDVGHQQKQEVEGAWRALPVEGNTRLLFIKYPVYYLKNVFWRYHVVTLLFTRDDYISSASLYVLINLRLSQQKSSWSMDRLRLVDVSQDSINTSSISVYPRGRCLRWAAHYLARVGHFH